jgi:hypothetical protein
MPPWTGLLLGALLSHLLPGDAAAPVVSFTPASDFTLQTGEICSDLSPRECCAQRLELVGFRAQGDHLPRLVKNVVKLACGDARRVMAPQACRNIAALRGFRSRDIDAICQPARVECASAESCKQCSAELQKLGYRGAHHVCRPLTYVKTSPARRGR